MRTTAVTSVVRGAYFPLTLVLLAAFVAALFGAGRKEIFLATGLVLLLPLTLYKLEVGILALVAVSVLLPVGFFHGYPLSTFTRPLFFPEIFLPLLAAVLLIRPVLVKGRPLRFSRLVLPMLLLVAVGSISAYRAIGREQYLSVFNHYVGVYLLLAPLLAYWVTLNIIRSRRAFTATIGTILLVGTIVSVLLILSFVHQEALGFFQQKGFETVTPIEKGLIGPLLVIVAVLAFSWVLSGSLKPLLRLLVIALLLLSLLAQAMLFSRGSLIATGIGFGVVMLLSVKRSLLFYVLAIVAAVLLYALVAPRVPQFFLQAAYYSDAPQQRETLARFQEWEDARSMWARDRLWGVGPGNYPYWATYVDYNIGRLIEQAHSQYFQLLAEVGIIGLGVFVWALMEMLREGVILLRQRRGPESQAFSAAFLGILVGMMVYGVVGEFMINDTAGGLFYFRGTLVFWVLLGLASAYLRILRRERAANSAGGSW